MKPVVVAKILHRILATTMASSPDERQKIKF